MPCYRCGARQSDPARGLSPWLRAVRADTQVLVCPECQQTHSWSNDVDHCPTCGSTKLIRRLGSTVCRDCEASATAEFLAIESTIDRGAAVRAAANAGRHRGRTDTRELTEEVGAAIDRVLGKHARRSSSEDDPSAADDERSPDRVTSILPQRRSR
jgi:uncharacterized Zn finger protein (UPF0148 family)